MKKQLLFLLFISSAAFAADKMLGKLELNLEVNDHAIGILLAKIQSGVIIKSCPKCTGSGKILKRKLKCQRVCHKCDRGWGMGGSKCSSCTGGLVSEWEEQPIPCDLCIVDLNAEIAKL